MEEWRMVKGYEDLYMVSNHGNVKSLVGWNGRKYIKRELQLRQTNTTSGYKKVELTKDGSRESKRVHRLVAEAFIANEQNKNVVNHKDLNKFNNHYRNLEWCTMKENADHAIINGANKNIWRPAVEDVVNIKKMYESGKSKKHICDTFGVSYTQILKICKDNSFKKPANVCIKYNYNLDEMIEMFGEGLSNKEIAGKLGTTNDLIATYRCKFKKGRIRNESIHSHWASN